MIFPNKLLNYQNSVLPKLVIIADILKQQPLSTLDLYDKVKKHVEDIDAYILSLEVLYILGKVDFEEKGRVIKYVENDNV